MTPPLNVLVIESRPGAAAEPIRELGAAGHHTLTCHDGRTAVTCRGLTSPDDCPLAQDPDVALLVRPRVDPHTSAREATAVVCAVRAGIPLVEAGPAHLDPYDAVVTARAVDGDVVAACEAGVDEALGALGRAILRQVTPTPATCRVERAGRRLHVRLDLPQPVDPAEAQALAVRALDAVRASGRAYGEVDVSVTNGGSGGTFGPGSR
ncbi:MAG TPA: hypothetical protein VKB57_19920 [Acidimicrobiales bacterium]|nr:hypothetical protein [Acidimicrobiales bacterium]